MKIKGGVKLSILYGRSSVVVYYESLKRELKTKPVNECRCDERLQLQTRVEESTRLTCPRLVAELEHGGTTFSFKSQVYLQQNKKKTEAEGKNCHAKTMLSLEKPIKLI